MEDENEQERYEYVWTPQYYAKNMTVWALNTFRGKKREKEYLKMARNGEGAYQATGNLELGRENKGEGK